jgi:hypothetical protein
LALAACGGNSDPPNAGWMLFTDFTLGASGSSLISSLMPLVSMTLFIITSFDKSQLLALAAGSLALSALFAQFVIGWSLLSEMDSSDDVLLVLLALSVVVLSLKILFTIFEDELLLLLLAVTVVDDFAFPSPLLLDSLSSTENGNTIVATHGSFHCRFSIRSNQSTKRKVRFQSQLKMHAAGKRFECVGEDWARGMKLVLMMHGGKVENDFCFIFWRREKKKKQRKHNH